MYPSTKMISALNVLVSREVKFFSSTFNMKLFGLFLKLTTRWGTAYLSDMGAPYGNSHIYRCLHLPAADNLFHIANFRTFSGHF